MRKTIQGKIYLFVPLFIVVMLAFVAIANAAVQKPDPIKGLKCKVNGNTVTSSWNKAARAKGYELKYVVVNKKGQSKTSTVSISKNSHSVTLAKSATPAKKLTVTVKAYNYNSANKKQYGQSASASIVFK